MIRRFGRARSWEATSLVADEDRAGEAGRVPMRVKRLEAGTRAGAHVCGIAHVRAGVVRWYRPAFRWQRVRTGVRTVRARDVCIGPAVWVRRTGRTGAVSLPARFGRIGRWRERRRECRFAGPGGVREPSYRDALHGGRRVLVGSLAARGRGPAAFARRGQAYRSWCAACTGSPGRAGAAARGLRLFPSGEGCPAGGPGCGPPPVSGGREGAGCAVVVGGGAGVRVSAGSQRRVGVDAAAAGRARPPGGTAFAGEARLVTARPPSAGRGPPPCAG